MKIFRYLILFSLLFLFNLPVMADVMPYYTGSLSKETIGFLQVPKSFKLYLYPRYDSQIIDTVQWTNTEVKLKNKTIEPSALFAAQIQSKGMAFCMVIDENEDNWYKIIYDKTTNSSGWIKAGSEDDFWGLRDFYSFYGRRYGLYYMKNIDYRKMMKLQQGEYWKVYRLFFHNIKRAPVQMYRCSLTDFNKSLRR